MKLKQIPFVLCLFVFLGCGADSSSPNTASLDPSSPPVSATHGSTTESGSATPETGDGPPDASSSSGGEADEEFSKIDVPDGGGSDSSTLNYLRQLARIETETNRFRPTWFKQKQTPWNRNYAKMRKVAALSTTGVDPEVVRFAREAIRSVEQYYRAAEERAKKAEDKLLKGAIKAMRDEDPGPLLMNAYLEDKVMQGFESTAAKKEAEHRVQWPSILEKLPRRYPGEAEQFRQLAENPDACSPQPWLYLPVIGYDPEIPGTTPDNPFELDIVDSRSSRSIIIEPRTSSYRFYFEFEWPSEERFHHHVVALGRAARVRLIRRSIDGFFIPRDSNFDATPEESTSGVREMNDGVYLLEILSLEELAPAEITGDWEPPDGGVEVMLWATDEDSTENEPPDELVSQAADYHLKASEEDFPVVSEEVLERREMRENVDLARKPYDDALANKEVFVGRWKRGAASGGFALKFRRLSRKTKLIDAQIYDPNDSGVKRVVWGEVVPVDNGFEFRFQGVAGKQGGKKPTIAGPPEAQFLLIDDVREIRLWFDGDKLAGQDDVGLEYSLTREIDD